MRRIFAILALVAAVGLVMGCTGNQSSTSGSGATAPPPSGGSSAPGGSCGAGGVG